MTTVQCVSEARLIGSYTQAQIDNTMPHLHSILNRLLVAGAIRNLSRRHSISSRVSDMEDVVGSSQFFHSDTESMTSSSAIHLETTVDEFDEVDSFHPSVNQSDSDSLYDVKQLLNAILVRVPWEFFDGLLKDIEMEFDQQDKQVFEQLSLRVCPETEQLHEYDSLRRCIQCQAQHCKDCETCFLRDCHLATSDPASLYFQLKNSLAVRRISGVCNQPQCQRGFEPEYWCRCTSHLYGTTGTPAGMSHRCRAGEFHLCTDCADSAMANLSKSNTLEAYICQTPNNKYTLHMYTCNCGRPANPSEGLRCKICYGAARFPKLNDLSWMSDPEAEPILIADEVFPINLGFCERIAGVWDHGPDPDQRECFWFWNEIPKEEGRDA